MLNTKKLGLSILSLIVSAVITAQTGYKYQLDLNKTSNDKVTITLTTPKITSDSVRFFLPKMVPGTYAIHNYGSYIENFKAFTKNGKELSVRQADKNTWVINGAKQLSTLSYEVNDTWDSPEIKEDVFEPAGTNIEKDSSYVINTFGFFGYFEKMEFHPFEIKIIKSGNLFGATSLTRTSLSNSKQDVFTAANYHFLADAPILYTTADTASIMLAKTKVVIAMDAKKKVVSAKEVADAIKPILEAQKNYLGGALPVNNYAFLIHLSGKKNLTRYGALEHSYSSLYFLPDFMNKEELITTLKDAASHEFLHIITPLNIHSEEIGNFDYMNPKMSKHLWFYEGLTEYAAHHAQVKGGLISREEYLNRQAGKIRVSRTNYNDSLPFTELSLGALDVHKDQYTNVYQKGALIGLCLDIQLRSLSNGTYSTQRLMADLSKTYGKNKSFKDDEFFKTIGKLSSPKIEAFLKTYVAGKPIIPYDSIFNVAGIKLTEKDTVYEAEIGFNTAMGVIPKTDTLYIASNNGQTNFAKRMGLTKDDKILEFNGKPLRLSNYAELFQEYSANAKLGDLVSWKVLRKNAKGVYEEVVLSAAIQNEPKIKPTLKVKPNLTKEESQLLNNWLGTSTTKS